MCFEVAGGSVKYVNNKRIWLINWALNCYSTLEFLAGVFTLKKWMWCMCWHIRPEAPPWNWQLDEVRSNNSDAPNVLHCLHFGPHTFSDRWRRLESAGSLEGRPVDQRPSSPPVTPPTRYLADHRPQILVFIYGHHLQHVHIDSAQNLVELLCLSVVSLFCPSLSFCSWQFEKTPVTCCRSVCT